MCAVKRRGDNCTKHGINLVFFYFQTETKIFNVWKIRPCKNIKCEERALIFQETVYENKLLERSEGGGSSVQWRHHIISKGYHKDETKRDNIVSLKR